MFSSKYHHGLVYNIQVADNNELARLNELVGEKSKALESLKEEKSSVELDLNAMKNQLEEKEKSLGEATSSLAEFQSENQSLHNQLQEKDALLTEKIQTLSVLEDKNKCLTSEIGRTEQRLRELDSAMKKLEVSTGLIYLSKVFFSLEWSGLIQMRWKFIQADRMDLEASESRRREEAQSKSEQLAKMEDEVSMLKKELDLKRIEMEKQRYHKTEGQGETPAMLQEKENAVNALKLTISTLTTEKQELSESLQHKHDEVIILSSFLPALHL